jgi:hypothetical protein
VAALAPALNGAAWALDVKRSGSIAPFMTLMGAPWLIAQAVKASGEPAAAWLASTHCRRVLIIG